MDYPFHAGDKVFYFGEETLGEEGICLQCRDEGRCSGEIFLCGKRVVLQACGGDGHNALGT